MQPIATPTQDQIAQSASEIEQAVLRANPHLLDVRMVTCRSVNAVVVVDVDLIAVAP